MKLNFCGICGSKPKDAKKPGKKDARNVQAPPKSQSKSGKSAQTVPVDEDKALDEFIRRLERQTTQIQAQQSKEMEALQEEFAQHQAKADRINRLFAQQNAVEDEALEQELAKLELEVNGSNQ